MCNLCGVEAGVAGEPSLHGEDRQRNIFPLPRIQGSAKPDTQHSGWEAWANQGIRALNELAGCGNSSFGRKKTTRAQRRALQHISKSFQEVHAVDIDDPGRSALQDLCSSSRLYQVDRSDVVSYVRESVSWPQVESTPVPLGECLAAADRERLATWRQHMLKNDMNIGDGPSIKHAYIDPILKHSPQEYVKFLEELKCRHMVSFSALCGPWRRPRHILCSKEKWHAKAHL